MQLTTSFFPAFSTWPSFIGFLPLFSTKHQGMFRRGQRSPIGRWESTKENNGFKIVAKATQPGKNIIIFLDYNQKEETTFPTKQQQKQENQILFVELRHKGNDFGCDWMKISHFLEGTTEQSPVDCSCRDICCR